MLGSDVSFVSFCFVNFSLPVCNFGVKSGNGCSLAKSVGAFIYLRYRIEVSIYKAVEIAAINEKGTGLFSFGAKQLAILIPSL